MIRIIHRILGAALVVAALAAFGCRGGRGSSDGAVRRYDWERGRKELLTTADAVLCYAMAEATTARPTCGTRSAWRPM